MVRHCGQARLRSVGQLVACVRYRTKQFGSGKVAPRGHGGPPRGSASLCPALAPLHEMAAALPAPLVSRE